MGIPLRHGQRFVAQQFLQRPDVNSPHGQMAGVGVPQVVEPKIINPRLSASRGEAMLNVPDVPAVPIAEKIA
jgi:hypothetical protein